jgi:hypothetical protein
MNRISRAALFALATFALMFAGATTDRSDVAVVGQPGGCASGCSVGGHGTGGVNSGGAAKGFHDKNLTDPSHPGVVIDNSGTDHSGHIVVTDEATGATIGSNSGGYARGIDDFVGHSTGVFGTCNGRSSKC